MVGMIVTAVLITVTGIVFKQPILRILPLYVSLVISLLQSKVNRYASLLGGINSILYAVVYVWLHIYGSAAYALLVSCPMQLITFFRWSKKPWGKATVFQKLSNQQRIGTAAAFVIAWITLFTMLHKTDADYIFLDCTGTLLGVFTSILMMLSYIEYAGLMLVNCLVSIVLNATIMLQIPGQSTYLVYSLYSLLCVTIAFIRAHRMYQEQEQAPNGA